HSNLGSICFQKGDLESAVRHWQAALEIDPGHIRSHQNLGGAFEKLGRLEEAAHEYRQAIGLSPANDAALFCSIARVLRRLGQTDQAAAYYRRSLAAVPGYPPAQQGLAELRPQNPLRPVPHPQGGFP
ncbi:MAG: tetratricopeptide repeat protein, partial [Planctomycetes bacterium]|nr:tetratricopeptide repeat protein [Planctomycetota bacterium]